MDKILIITYYWPPSGGAGVQRWLKLSKYLSKNDIEVHVVTVDPAKASYLQLDESLSEEISSKTHVHLTNSFEPINYYAKVIGKSNVPTGGFSNVNASSFKQKIVNAVRSHLFIPDPRKGWNKYAFKKAIEVIEKFDIKHIVTTSPPHSTQLIGLRLKRKLGDKIKWISDFRDTWTDIFYYPLLQHSRFSDRINKRYEKSVLEESDKILTVTRLFKETLAKKSNLFTEDKISIVPNGFDPEDFERYSNFRKDDSKFIITYTGTISDNYEPQVFFLALGKLKKQYPNVDIEFRLVGVVTDNIRKFILDLIGDSAKFIATVSHDEAISYMVQSDLLLLITPGDPGTIPGKTFEYLASKNRIICIGVGDASEVVEQCLAGKGFERHQSEEIYKFLEEMVGGNQSQNQINANLEAVNRFSRLEQANKIIDICKE